MTVKSGSITPDPIANPTVAGKQEVPIAPLSCWAVGVIGSVLTFPTQLQEERLQKAFAKAAGYWPVVAGRYVKASNPGTEFAISLTQSPIPFDTQTADVDYPYENKAVVQDDLGEWVTPLADNFFEAGADAPLVTVRFSTLKSGGSALGVNWSHVLGDAAAFSRFLEDVSIFYNLPYTDLESDEVPTFQPHVRLPAATAAIKEQFQIPILTRLPLGEVFKGYSDAVAQSHRFTVNLSPDDLAHIAAVRLPGDKVTDNDLVCAWWCSVLERAGQPLDWVIQTINYRNWHKGDPAFPRNLPTLSANVAQQRQIHLPPRVTGPKAPTKPGTRVLQIARAIRGGMHELQNDRDKTLGWLANAAHEIGAAAHEGTSFCLVPSAGGVVLNSNWRYDWAVKFGQESAAYHTGGSFPRILRVFRANPEPGQKDEDRAIELSFRVDSGPSVEAVQKVIADERARWKAEGPVHEHEDDEEEPEVKQFNMHSTVAREPWGGYGI